MGKTSADPALLPDLDDGVPIDDEAEAPDADADED